MEEAHYCSLLSKKTASMEKTAKYYMVYCFLVSDTFTCLCTELFNKCIKCFK